MTMTIDRAAMATWHAATFTEEQIAAGLACWAEDVRIVLSAPGFGRTDKSMSARQKVGIAVSLALHRQAGMSLPAAADVVSGAWRVCESVLATVDFVPPDECDADPGRPPGEHDPFALFAPYAGEAVAIPAIDEFLDVLDGRRICWRRPRRDAYRLAAELHRISTAVRREATPAIEEEYLALLCSLRAPADHVSEWIGTVTHDRFRPAPNRFAEASPGMRQSPEMGSDPSRFAESYGTRVSVNVSLAARCFKRRMLGLPVTDPFETSPRNRTTSMGAARS